MGNYNIFSLILKASQKLNILLLRAIRIAIVSCFGITILLCLCQVIFRYLLRFPLFWAEEIMRLFFVWVIYIGISLCFYEKSHIVVSFVYERFPSKVKAGLQIFIYVLNILFLLLMVLLGFKIIWFVGGQILPATGVPVYLLYLSYPVAGLMALIFIVGSLIDRKKKECS